MRKYTLKTKFGMTLRQYNYLLKKQNGCCAICGYKPEGEDRYRKGKSLAVDHDHVTGKIRGLLCDKCNRGLGHFNDNPRLLVEAVLYLQQTGTYLDDIKYVDDNADFRHFLSATFKTKRN
jgi:hypothetical protein